MKSFGSLALVIGVSLFAISQAGAQSNGKLYAYANPFIGPLADHTWVTDYPSRPTCPNPAADYWYSAGNCHPSRSDNEPRLLASAEANLGKANCIAEPNNHTVWPAGPATADILYGIDGVCHQIANRILAATGTQGREPITVAGAHGYKFSRYVYGEYGNSSQWEELRKKCEVAAAPALKARDDLAMMVKEARLEAKTALIQREQSLLRRRIAEIARRAKAAKLSSRSVADQINNAINVSLQRLARSIGPADFERLFGVSPVKLRIVLVDPEVAAQVNYVGK